MNKGPEQFRKELVEVCTKGSFYSTGGGTAQFVRNLIVHVCRKMDKKDEKALQDLIRNVIHGLPILHGPVIQEFVRDVSDAWEEEHTRASLVFNEKGPVPGLYDGPDSAPTILSTEAHVCRLIAIAPGDRYGLGGLGLPIDIDPLIEALRTMYIRYFDEDSLDGAAAQSQVEEWMTETKFPVSGIGNAVKAYIDNVIEHVGPYLQKGEETCLKAVYTSAEELDDEALAIHLLKSDHGRRLLGCRFFPDNGMPDVLLMSLAMLKREMPNWMKPSDPPLLDPDMASFARLMRYNGCILDSLEGRMNAQGWFAAWDNIMVYLQETRGLKPWRILSTTRGAEPRGL